LTGPSIRVEIVRLPDEGGAMRYLLLIHSGAETRDWPMERGRACYEEMLAWTKGLEARGKLLQADPLRQDREGARLRLREGKPVVTDGPFVETKDVVGGFVMIECANRDEAVATAKTCPALKWSTVEVREIWDDPWRGDG
jgi:hypothetical protein